MSNIRASARACALLGLLLSCAALAGPQATEIEQRVKSAFLFNFAKFVTWPARKFAAPNSPIEICVRPGDEIAPILEETLAGKSIGTRLIVVRTPGDGAAWAGCHVAYLGKEPIEQTVITLRSLAGYAVMTVHEADHALTGGVVRLYLEDRKLRFEINVASAKRENLQLSARLLSLATVVER